LQNPTLRAADGKVAKLRIGTRQPVAQGSFQPTFAGNVGGTPVVNFTYIDVGVNLDLTPHVLMNRDISMNVVVEVSSITGQVTFGGGTSGTVQQPILGQRHIEHDLRLKEGESSIIGGIISSSDTVTNTGYPGLLKVPILRYFFSTENKERQEGEIVVVITPHIIRLPEYNPDDFGAIAIIGAGNSPRLIGRPVQLTGDNPPVSKGVAPASPTPASSPAAGQALPPPPATSQPQVAESTAAPQAAPRLALVRLNSSSPEVAAGAKFAVSAAIENAQNAFALSLNLSFNPKVLKFVEAQNGGFLSSDGAVVAIAPRPDNEAGQAVVSMTRPPESAGMNGRGVLLNLIFEAVAAGVSPINFTQANIRDPGQATLPTSFTGTQVTVK
ncbi:MAG TPA: cohesin domain-containing protein, partial [Terriglobia bacterium]|nr:cohesin domain-containing protein [Terriglobia bacterium]